MDGVVSRRVRAAKSTGPCPSACHRHLLCHLPSCTRVSLPRWTKCGRDKPHCAMHTTSRAVRSPPDAMRWLFRLFRSWLGRAALEPPLDESGHPTKPRHLTCAHGKLTVYRFTPPGGRDRVSCLAASPRAPPKTRRRSWTRKKSAHPLNDRAHSPSLPLREQMPTPPRDGTGGKTLPPGRTLPPGQHTHHTS